MLTSCYLSRQHSCHRQQIACYLQQTAFMVSLVTQIVLVFMFNMSDRLFILSLVDSIMLSSVQTTFTLPSVDGIHAIFSRQLIYLQQTTFMLSSVNNVHAIFGTQHSCYLQQIQSNNVHAIFGTQHSCFEFRQHPRFSLKSNQLVPAGLPIANSPVYAYVCNSHCSL